MNRKILVFAFSFLSAISSFAENDYTHYLSNIQSSLNSIDSEQSFATELIATFMPVGSQVDSIYNILADRLDLSRIESILSGETLSFPTVKVRGLDTSLDFFLQSFEYHLSSLESSLQLLSGDEFRELRDLFRSIDGKIVDRDYTSLLTSIDGKFVDYSDLLASINFKIVDRDYSSLLTSIAGNLVDYSDVLASIDSNIVDRDYTSLLTSIDGKILDHDYTSLLTSIDGKIVDHDYTSLLTSIDGKIVDRDYTSLLTSIDGKILDHDYTSLLNSISSEMSSIRTYVGYLYDFWQYEDGYGALFSYQGFSRDILNKLDELKSSSSSCNYDDSTWASFRQTVLDYLAYSSDTNPSNNVSHYFKWLQDDDLLHTTLFKTYDESSTNKVNDNFFDHTVSLLNSILSSISHEDHSDYAKEIEQKSSDFDPEIIKGDMNIPERVSFLEGASDRFDYSSVLSVYGSSYMPAAITLRLPGVFGIAPQYVAISTDSIAPFCEVSRTCFTILYWCLVGGLVFFAFKFFIPAVKFFVNILSKVMIW